MSAERLFLDTAYVQALLNGRAQYHRPARALYARVRAAREVWVTEAVLLEVGNALAEPSECEVQRHVELAGEGRVAMSRSGEEATREAVQAAHDAWFRGLLASDVESLSQLLDDDLTLSYPTGTLGRKDALLQRLAEGTLTYDSADIKPAELRIFGETAIFTGLSTLWYTSRGQSDREDLRYTAVYFHRPEGWRLVAWHSTRGGR